MTKTVDQIKRMLADAVDRDEICDHFMQANAVIPNSDVCDKCIELGDTWVNLRLCLICGRVGCCDNSKNKHATKHYHASDHPIIMSFESNDEWLYCYPDEGLIAL